MGETLSSRTHTLCFSSLPVMGFKSLPLLHNWDSDQGQLIGIEAQHLFPTIIFRLTCRHEQTIDYVNVQTPDPFPQSSFISDRLKWSKTSDDEHTKSLYSPSVPITFPQMRKCFPSVLARRLYQVPVRMYRLNSQRNPAKHKKTSGDNFQNEF